MFDPEAQNRISRTAHRRQQLRRRKRQRIVFGVACGIILSIIIGIFVALGGETDGETRIAESAVTVTKTVINNDLQETTTTAVPPEAVSGVSEAETVTSVPAGSLAGVVICIDPGHADTTDAGMEPIGPGASELKVKDPGGTSGINSGVREPAITLAISLRLRDLLQAEGATVVMTRENSSYIGGNRDRAAVANQAGADLFIRIHADGSTNSAKNGASTLYPASISGWTDDIYSKSMLAAQSIQASMVANLGVTDGGIVERSDICGFNWADVPAVLAEVGFMTNPGEDAKLNSPEYQQQVAQALLMGIKDYIS